MLNQQIAGYKQSVITFSNGMLSAVSEPSGDRCYRFYDFGETNVDIPQELLDMKY